MCISMKLETESLMWLRCLSSDEARGKPCTKYIQGCVIHKEKDASEAQTDGVLLAYNGTELYGLCETLQHLSNIRRLYAKPLASYRSILAYLSLMR